MIDNLEQFEDWLPRLRKSDWVAMDTEADSLHAYPEKLCLLQFSIPGEDRLVDPLAGLQLDPLWDALATRELIFHGADYDLRLLKRTFEFVPHSMFDTMIAARLLGIERFGLSHLCEQLLGIVIQKGPQKADWARRPLTAKMEEYARTDTRVLKDLSDLLRTRLQEKGRLPWQMETCDRLIRECSKPQEIDHERVWRIKGSSKLNRRALGVLRELWQWREGEALANNRPVYFVLSHDRMVSIASSAAEGRPFEEFLPRRISQNRRKRLIEAVQAGRALAEKDLPKILRGKREIWTNAQRKLFNELEARRNRQAARLEIDSSLIASRATLGRICRTWPDHDGELMQWQSDLLQ